jgi:hypothetical protein
LHIDDDHHRFRRVDLIKMIWHVDLSRLDRFLIRGGAQIR